MKLFIALLTAAVVFPLAAGLGYIANPDPAPPPVPSATQRLSAELKPVPEVESVEYLSSPTKGDCKGQEGSADFGLTASAEDLREICGITAADVRFFVRECRGWSTDGTATSGIPRIVVSCESRDLTRAQMRKALEGAGLTA